MDTIIHKPWHDHPYVMVDKGTINDARLSFKALGLLVYLIAKPANWQVCLQHLATTHKEGIDAVRSAMNELLTCGYAKRVILRHDNGTIAGTHTFVSEVPFPPDTDESVSGEATPTDRAQSDGGASAIDTSLPPEHSKKHGKTPPTTPLFGHTPYKPGARPGQLGYSEAADQVLLHLNSLTKINYKGTGFIPARLKDGYTVEDCILVLDWLHEERRLKEPDWVAQYMDQTTPFRPVNFDRYLQKAKQWRQRGGVDAMHQMAREVADKIIAEQAHTGEHTLWSHR